MSEMTFPLLSDFDAGFGRSPFPPLYKKLPKLDQLDAKSNGIEGLKRHLDLNEYVLQLNHRVADACKSYVLMMHFYDQGIPDKEWRISPGRSGSSVEYFPHFEEVHFRIKSWFDYYAGMFYQQAFSALDMIGHILNIHEESGLDESKVDFDRVIRRLQEVNPDLFKQLSPVARSDTIKRARLIRNSITHRVLPSTAGMAIVRKGHTWSLGLREYATSRSIVDAADRLIGSIGEAVDALVSSPITE